MMMTMSRRGHTHDHDDMVKSRNGDETDGVGRKEVDDDDD